MQNMVQNQKIEIKKQVLSSDFSQNILVGNTNTNALITIQMIKCNSFFDKTTI